MTAVFVLGVVVGIGLGAGLALALIDGTYDDADLVRRLLARTREAQERERQLQRQVFELEMQAFRRRDPYRRGVGRD